MTDYQYFTITYKAEDYPQPRRWPIKNNWKRGFVDGKRIMKIGS
jgi:hypothetical protein